MFNALEQMLNPACDGAVLPEGALPTGEQQYWKAAAFMHMLEQYMDVVLGGEVRTAAASQTLHTRSCRCPID